MREIYDSRKIDNQDFLLAEHIGIEDGGYVEAQVAAFTYRAEGWLVRVERDDDAMCYYIWVGPERVRKVGLLPDEVVQKRNPIERMRVRIS